MKLKHHNWSVYHIDEKQKVIKEILRYLIEHPEGMDTIEGMQQWWVSRDALGLSEREIQEAVEDLVSKKWLTVRETLSSQRIFGLNKSRLNEIKLFLNRSG